MRALLPLLTCSALLVACIPDELTAAATDGAATPDTTPMDGATDTRDGASADVSRKPDSSIDGEGGSGGDGGFLSDAPSGCDACALVVPSGWSVVQFAASQAQPCPGGLSTADFVENPTATSGACTCGACSVSTPPNCQSGSIATQYGSGGANCPVQGFTLSANGGQCTSMSAVLGNSSAANAPAPTGGACTANASSNPSAVTSQADRACTASSGCACTAAAGFTTCLAANGDQACPPSAATKHLVGSSVAVVCGSCSCSVTSTCSGTLDYYADVACMNLVAMLPGDGSCHLEGSRNFSSYRWAGTAQNVACTVGTSTGALSLTGEATVCCP